jgi:hypothetical protein
MDRRVTAGYPREPHETSLQPGYCMLRIAEIQCVPSPIRQPLHRGWFGCMEDQSIELSQLINSVFTEYRGTAVFRSMDQV